MLNACGLQIIVTATIEINASGHKMSGYKPRLLPWIWRLSNLSIYSKA